MSKIACCCGNIMKVDRVGVTFVETTDDGLPIAIWSGDLMICPTCMTGCIRLANEPYCQGYDPSFDEQLAIAVKRKAYGLP